MKSLFLAAFSVAAAVTSVHADGLPTTPYVYVQGAAEERVDPDQLTLTFQLNATDQDQVRAKALVTDKSAAVFQLLAQLGVKDDAIVAQALSVGENYDFSSSKRVLNGYTVTRAFSVRLQDLTLYPKLVNGLVDLHVESVDNAQPGYSKAAERSTALKKAAMAQARQEASDLAASTGAKITGIFAVSPIAFGEIPQAIFGGNGTRPVVADAFMVRAAKNAPGDKYLFDKLTLSERLHVIFLVEPAGK